MSDFDVRGVSRVFGKGQSRVVAVNDVSLSVQPGQRVGIVGESGSGKSTLVRLMAGLLPATSGDIEFDGRSITGLKESELGF
ncbi:MAG: ATP-binding cassette domain-containing protein, partial [Propionibacteriaceae bacterium]|nr:ATP-binding cassette domain-containing protein [Propionibacteriaceae bacterium]